MSWGPWPNLSPSLKFHMYSLGWGDWTIGSFAVGSCCYSPRKFKSALKIIRLLFFYFFIFCWNRNVILKEGLDYKMDQIPTIDSTGKYNRMPKYMKQRRQKINFHQSWRILVQTISCFQVFNVRLWNGLHTFIPWPWVGLPATFNGFELTSI